MLAIMGASGSGKTTLLDALAGRLHRSAALTGDVLVNGRPQRLSYGGAAYVPQEDVMLGTLSVGETLKFVALLRLPEASLHPTDQQALDSRANSTALQPTRPMFCYCSSADRRSEARLLLNMANR